MVAAMNSAQLHLLNELRLPDRFEALFEQLGPEIARVLVQPDPSTMAAFKTISISINSRREGAFIPVFGESGAGKTTIASSLSTFFPKEFTPSIQHAGEISFEALKFCADEANRKLPTNEKRILPINLDHREGAPPNSQELADIKRFLRAPSPGSRCVLLWPETTLTTANQIAKNFQEIAGETAIQLPLHAHGPERSVWRDIVKSTLQIVNNIENLEAMGVDPDSYNPEELPTIGKFMQRISADFSRNLQQAITSTEKPLSIIIVFASESSDSGVLEKLCNSSRLGLLDAAALISATPNSVIGKWWNDRRGLLIQTILKLNAHAFPLGPTASVTALRQHGESALKEDLAKLGLTSPGPKLLHQSLTRSQLGKFLLGKLSSSTEDRGTPADTSTTAFQLLAEKGFTYGSDKSLNKSMHDALLSFLASEEISPSQTSCEERLSFCPLIPDNSFLVNSDESENLICIEYTWRKGDFLGTSNKSGCAQYILEKLQSYARALSWTSD